VPKSSPETYATPVPSKMVETPGASPRFRQPEKVQKIHGRFCKFSLVYTLNFKLPPFIPKRGIGR